MWCENFNFCLFLKQELSRYPLSTDWWFLEFWMLRAALNRSSPWPFGKAVWECLLHQRLIFIFHIYSTNLNCYFDLNRYVSVCSQFFQALKNFFTWLVDTGSVAWMRRCLKTMQNLVFQMVRGENMAPLLGKDR